MKTQRKILHLLEKNREKIKSFGVKELGVFGSVARDEQTETSDVDVLVELEKKTFDAYMNLLFFLEELFESKVDLVMKPSKTFQMKLYKPGRKSNGKESPVFETSQLIVIFE